MRRNHVATTLIRRHFTSFDELTYPEGLAAELSTADVIALKYKADVDVMADITECFSLIMIVWLIKVQIYVLLSNKMAFHDIPNTDISSTL